MLPFGVTGFLHTKIMRGKSSQTLPKSSKRYHFKTSIKVWIGWNFIEGVKIIDRDIFLTKRSTCFFDVEVVKGSSDPVWWVLQRTAASSFDFEGPTVRLVFVRYSYLLVTQIIEVRWQYEPKIESEKPVCLMAIFSIHLFLSSEAR